MHTYVFEKHLFASIDRFLTIVIGILRAIHNSVLIHVLFVIRSVLETPTSNSCCYQLFVHLHYSKETKDSSSCRNMNSPTSPHRRYFRRNTRRLTSHQSVSAYCLPESQIDPGHDLSDTSNLSLEAFITRSKPASITLEGADSNGNANSLDEFQIDSEKSRVSFGTVRVHKHKNVLGNNPSCSRGLPVELDWNHCESQTFHVDAFEEIQSANPKGAIRIHPQDREHILRLKGHSQESFQNVLLEIDSIKISREAAVDESATKRRGNRRTRI